MLDKIVNILNYECKLNIENYLVIGFSGGPDSLCLLHILHHLGYPTTAVHVNHRLRPEADEEARQVKQVADSLKMDFYCYQVDVVSFAEKESISIEEAARTLRYRSLFEQAIKSGASAVLVGHNADDQVETILMHLLRGSGLAGLRGMEYRAIPNPWSDQIPLIRPLLSTRRLEIQKYIDDHLLHPISDSSNKDVSFMRNRVRHELIPILESYNPRIREVVLQMGVSIRDDYFILEEQITDAFNSALRKQEKGFLVFDSTVFLQLPISIQRNLLRKAIAHHIPGLRDVSFDCIERGRRLIAEKEHNSQTDLIAGVSLIKEGKLFIILSSEVKNQWRDYPALYTGEILELHPPCSHMLNNGWRLEVIEMSKSTLDEFQGYANQDPYQAWLDASNVDLPLIARMRKPGDQIKPMGLKGQSVKISDLMINLKLPKQVRASWPIICSGSEIVWVPGCRISENTRIKPGTSRIIHLRLFWDRTT
jgi:tRNA(Ile)-lysidine synthase